MIYLSITNKEYYSHIQSYKLERPKTKPELLKANPVIIAQNSYISHIESILFVKFGYLLFPLLHLFWLLLLLLH